MTRSSTLTILSLVFISATASSNTGTNWTNIEGGNALVNEASIQRVAGGNVRSWQKDFLLPQVREKLQLDLRAAGVRVDYSNYEFSIKLWEYDCARKKYAAIGGADYSNAGEVINSFEIDKPVFKLVIPESWAEARMKYVCGHKNAQKRQ